MYQKFHQFKFFLDFSPGAHFSSLSVLPPQLPPPTFVGLRLGHSWWFPGSLTWQRVSQHLMALFKTFNPSFLQLYPAPSCPSQERTCCFLLALRFQLALVCRLQTQAHLSLFPLQIHQCEVYSLRNKGINPQE